MLFKPDMKFKIEQTKINLRKAKFYISEYKDKDVIIFRKQRVILFELAKFHVKMAEEYLNA